MDKLSLTAVAALLSLLSGCAAPVYYQRDNLDCYRKEKKANRDFRGNVITKQYTDSLKNKVEDYIAVNPGTSEETKARLKEFKVVIGMTAEEVKVLLGDPERVQPLNSGNKFKADTRWVYMMKDAVCVYVVPVPLFFTHNAYHLYFKNGVLVGIEEVKLKYS